MSETHETLKPIFEIYAFEGVGGGMMESDSCRLGEKSNNVFYVCLATTQFDQKLEAYARFYANVGAL